MNTPERQTSLKDSRGARQTPFLLVRFRAHSGSLTHAAFLSARNNTLANIAIIAAGLVTAATVSSWPDLIVGLGFPDEPRCGTRGLHLRRQELSLASAEP